MFYFFGGLFNYGVIGLLSSL